MTRIGQKRVIKAPRTTPVAPEAPGAVTYTTRASSRPAFRLGRTQPQWSEYRVPSEARFAELVPDTTARLRVDAKLPKLSTRAESVLNGDVEDTGLTPSELLGLVRDEFDRVATQLGVVAAIIPGDARTGYEEEIAIVRQRIDYWQQQIAALAQHRGRLQQELATDIVIGERILLDRVIRLGAQVFSEPIGGGETSRLGLRSRRPQSRRHRPRPDRSGQPHPKRQPGGDLVPALINHNIGYGKRLSLRDHQIMAHNRFVGLLRMRRAQIGSRRQLAEELLRGTVVMPTGGGKTRTMVSCFAAAIAEGAFVAKRGDKVVIYNHTDQIHSQNLDVVKLLQPYFRKEFDRDMRITEWKADTKDLSGDIVVVSVPSINTAAARDTFESSMRDALGDHGEIVVGAVDEIHHEEMGRGKGEESWVKANEVLRKLSPNMFRLGFTATPTGREGPYIIRIRERDLMEAGLLPRTYLVKVRGVSLNQLKVGKTARDVSTKQLVSVMLDHPERNRRLYEDLEAVGVRRDDLSPSGRARLQATLGFAADLQHARMMAEDYVQFFGRRGDGDLRQRSFHAIGLDRGKFTQKDLDAAIAAYHAGTTDAVVAVVSGHTSEKLRNAVREAADRGEIEAVFNVDVWFEGADLDEFWHQLGGRSTFSRYKKGQERGRINRRSKGDVTNAGRLINDHPKILFDVIDSYHSHDRHLFSYGDVMGVLGYGFAQYGELFDAVAGEVVSAVDLVGRSVRRGNLRELVHRPEEAKRPDQATLDRSPWGTLVAQLWDRLDTQYVGDVGAMALDLGVPLIDLQNLLWCQGWKVARWFLRRLATLLYFEDRECLEKLYHGAAEFRGTEIDPQDVDLIRGALATYQQWEGEIRGGLMVTGDAGWGEQQVIVPQSRFNDLTNGWLNERGWRLMMQGMMLYYGNVSRSEGPHQEEAQQWTHILGRYLFDREEWSRKVVTHEDRLRLMAREGVVLHFGGRLPTDTEIDGVAPQSKKASLMRWLRGERPQDIAGDIAIANLYRQIRLLLIGMGKDTAAVDEAIVAAVFDERRWPTTASTKQEELLLWTRRLVALHYGGQLPIAPDIAGVNKQAISSPLYVWIKQGKYPFVTRGNRAIGEYYSQVRCLLEGLGAQPQEVKTAIIDAIFEERPGWTTTATTRREALLLRARRLVAEKHGGVLPQTPDTDAIGHQSHKAILQAWLRDGTVKYTPRCTPQEFYTQVKALLMWLGDSELSADIAVINAAFEESTWDFRGTAPSDKLRRMARFALAQHGMLFTATGSIVINGEKRVMGKMMKRWLAGESARSVGKRKGMWSVYDQIRELLVDLDVDPTFVDAMIVEAVFQEQGWPWDRKRNRPAKGTTARGQLRQMSRAVMARDRGGEFSQQNPVEGTGQTVKGKPLDRWLKGSAPPYSQKYWPSSHYAYVTNLLNNFGVAPLTTRHAVLAAVFEENDWKTTAVTQEERIRFVVRVLLAVNAGGHLRMHSGIDGLPEEIKKDAPLRKWIAEKPVPWSRRYSRANLLCQVRSLMIGLGAPQSATDDMLSQWDIAVAI